LNNGAKVVGVWQVALGWQAAWGWRAALGGELRGFAACGTSVNACKFAMALARPAQSQLFTRQSAVAGGIGELRDDLERADFRSAHANAPWLAQSQLLINDSASDRQSAAIAMRPA